MGAAAVVPVKAFSQAKLRLAPTLSPQARRQLAMAMAAGVVKACSPLPVFVVCDDLEVAGWASRLGARALPEPGLGLNGAVSTAVAQLASEGYRRLVVAHADLPLAKDLSWLAGKEGIVLVPDRRGDGTNVISLPANAGFRFCYGPGSFARHYQEAVRLGLPVEVARDPELGWDIDLAEDMRILA